MGASRIDQFVPSLARHDAIGNHVLQLRRLLRANGYRSDIYYEHVDPHLSGDTLPFSVCDPAPQGDRTILYHASTHSDMTYWLMRAAAGGQRIVVDYHNITPARYFSRWDLPAARSMELGRHQLAELAPFVTSALADSEYNAAELADFGIDGAAACPILLDLDEYHGEPDPAALSRLDTHPLWLFVGRIAPNKCQHDVLAAFAVYRRLYAPDARLVLVGSSTSSRYLGALLSLVAELGLENSVDMPGSTPFPVLLAYFRRADVFVCLSEHEGFCVPVIEAMELGVPVVAYPAAAVTETVAGAGVLVPDKDPLTVATHVDRLLGDQDRLAAVRAAGEERAGQFSREVTARRWLAELSARAAGE